MWETLIYDAVDDAATEELRKALTPAAREQIAQSLYDWLLQAPKAEVPNLVERLAEMRKRIDAMAEDLDVAMENGEFVVRATGDAETVLRMFELGTDWFVPAPGVKEMIFAVLA